MAITQRTRWIPNPLIVSLILFITLMSTGCESIQPSIDVGIEKNSSETLVDHVINADEDEKVTSTITPSTKTTPTGALPLITTQETQNIPDQPDENRFLYVPLLGFPLPEDASNQIETTYRFGSTMFGERIPHDGVEMVNPIGTPVIATEDGIVVFSGNDQTVKTGRFTNFYGNTIILKHNLTNYPDPIFTLFAHLSEILVVEGEEIKQGQTIGFVGSSGAAFTNHLHFEVRVGDLVLSSARNPELFLPLSPTEEQSSGGILVGKLIDKNNHPIPGASIVIQSIIDGVIQSDSSLYLETYDQSISGVDKWNENFVISNLPVGNYRVSTFAYGVFIEEFVTLRENELIFITLQPEE